MLVVVACLFAALFGRLWFLQGVEAGSAAVAQVATQGIETVYIPAPRGEIFDRNGVLLAGNRIEQVVTVLPGAEAAHPGIVDELSAVLGEPAARVKAAIDNVQYSPYQPVPVAEGVSTAAVLAIDENQSLLPGVVVQAEPVRYYPYGADDGQHRRLRQPDHRVGVRPGQGPALRRRRPLLPDWFGDRPGRRRRQLREVPPGPARGRESAGGLPGARPQQLHGLAACAR